MAERVYARLTRQQGRRFGLTVGGAFLLLAAVIWWRGGEVVAAVLGSLGGVLAAAGLLIPRQLGPVERGWMALAHVISKVTTPIVMGVIYGMVITPVGALRRRLGGNPLVHSDINGSFWRARSAGARRSKSLERQF